MQKILKFVQFLGLLFLIGMFWFVFNLLTLTLVDGKNDNNDYIPDEATTVYHIDGTRFTRQTLNTLLLHEDKELSSLIQDLLPESSDGKLKPLGISFSSDLIQFEIAEKEGRYSGILFNLSSPHFFKKNMALYLGEEVAIAANDRVGLLLTQNGLNLSKHALQVKAESMLRKKTNFAKKHPIKLPGVLLSAWNRSESCKDGLLQLELKGQELHFKGALDVYRSAPPMLEQLEPNGFHLTSGYLPDFINDSLQKYVSELGITLPEITGVSINYLGTKIISDPILVILPKADIYLEFAANIELDSLLLQEFVAPRKATDPENLRILDIYGVSYWVRQQSPRSLIISSSPHPKMQKGRHAAFLIEGAPKFLFELEGDGLVKRVVEMAPIMSSSRNAANGISTVNIRISKDRNNVYLVDGLVQFKPNEWPINTFFKFLIRSKLFS